MTTTYFGSPVTWPSLTASDQYYVDVILYAKQPIYFGCADLSPDQNPTTWKLYANYNANPVYVITMTNTSGLKDYSAVVRKVPPTLPGSTNKVKPADVIESVSQDSTRIVIGVFNNAKAMSRYAYQYSIGYYACFYVRQGTTALRAPVWTGEYNYSWYDPTADNWVNQFVPPEPGVYVPPVVGFPASSVPLQPRPVVARDDAFEKNFKYVANVLDSIRNITLYNQVAPTTLTQSTPWLDNPTTFSN